VGQFCRKTNTVVEKEAKDGNVAGQQEKKEWGSPRFLVARKKSKQSPRALSKKMKKGRTL